MNTVTFTNKTSICILNLVATKLFSTGCTPNKGGTKREETGLLLQPVPPDDIRNITAIAKKLRRSVVIEEHFEFAIRAAHTVKYQHERTAYCEFRESSAIQPP